MAKDRMDSKPDRQWFRKLTWTAGDEQDFHARLGRARSDYNKAQCHEAQGRISEAVQAMREAVDRSATENGGRNTDAASHLALLVARHGLGDQYDEALALLTPQDVSMILPLVQARVHAAMALMAADTGGQAEAARHARQALDLLGQDPQAGLDQALCNKLQALAAQGRKPRWRFWG